jgi:chemotaxis-related protein WspD
MAGPVVPGGERCWAAIGVWGDRTCPELATCIHCRNCDVYTAAGRGVLDREMPDDYREELTRVAGASGGGETPDALSVLIIELGGSCFALPVAVCREVIAAAPIRRIPHRSNAILLGLVSVRGQLRVAISLMGLGLVTTSAAGDFRKMLLVGHGDRQWALPVGDVLGLHHMRPAEIERPPAQAGHASPPFVCGVACWAERRVGVLDHELLVSAIARSLA